MRCQGEAARTGRAPGPEAPAKALEETRLPRGSLAPDGPAAEAGLRRGDVIAEVNRRPVHNVRQYEKALGASGKGKSVLFLVRRGENTIFLAVRPADQ